MMALRSSTFQFPPLCSPLKPAPDHYLSSRLYRSRHTKNTFVMSTSPNSTGEETRRPKLMEFPHLTSSHRDLMVDLISALENRFDSQLLPSVVPPDVQYYQNQTGSSQGTLHIRSAIDSSPIDFILASWLHLKQPNGDAFNITNIQGYLKPTTDIPNFQFELVQCSPNFLIFFLDIIPRKDIVLHPDYLKTFYADTKLEQHRQKLAQVPGVEPYFSSSLYFRRVVSPTGILVSVKGEKLEEIISEHISPISKEVLKIWIDLLFSCEGREVVDENERVVLEKRDFLIKSKAIEMDLSANMPLQFGDEVANRVLRVIRNAFKTS